jgi:hypothetical protein
VATRAGRGTKGRTLEAVATEATRAGTGMTKAWREEVVWAEALDEEGLEAAEEEEGGGSRPALLGFGNILVKWLAYTAGHKAW